MNPPLALSPPLREPVPAASAPVTLSVVVPVFNEAAVIADFHRRLAAVLDALGETSEIVYVNDGSRDDSMRQLRAFADADARIVLLDFSRNFGKEIAMTAGLDHAAGDAVVVIDSDLQDPPELIPDMLRAWRSGADVVLMRRESRQGESWFKKASASWFYRLIGSIGEMPIPADVGDFRLLSRRAVEALRRMPERTRFMKGLFAWVGFEQVTIDYQRDARFAGETKWNYWRLWNLALEGITSFSSAPLKLASYVGLATAIYALGAGAYVFGKALLFGDPVAGYPSLMVTVLFLGGVQLIALGIIGEYLARMFVEVKGRPLYLLSGIYRRRAAARDAGEAGDASSGGA
ncbi:MAG TPA: glycosyltransferase family 2 protein [Burkholderiaceae bacterium]|nr:glycosyltransferase family 2 protein [Burkholderiaceae bacterium]